MRATALGLMALAGPARAEMTVETTRYLCERGVEVPVTYAIDTGAEGQAIAVIGVEGGQFTLFAEPAASGARYDWPSDGSAYVWWSKGDGATLLWKDGAAGEETTLLAECKRQ